MIRTPLSIFTVITLLVIGVGGSAAAEPSIAEKNFKKLLYDHIGAEWCARMEAHRGELAVGSTRIHIVLSHNGVIRDLRVMSNTSSKRIATLLLDAIRHSKISPPPREILRRNTFEDNLTFTVYAKQTNEALELTATGHVSSFSYD